MKKVLFLVAFTATIPMLHGAASGGSMPKSRAEFVANYIEDHKLMGKLPDPTILREWEAYKREGVVAEPIEQQKPLWLTKEYALEFLAEPGNIAMLKKTNPLHLKILAAEAYGDGNYFDYHSKPPKTLPLKRSAALVGPVTPAKVGTAEAISVKDLLVAGELKSNSKYSIDPAYYSLEDKKLKSLDGLKEIPNIDQMKSLSLRGNQFDTLPADTFSTLENLHYIDLRDNKNLVIVAEGAFNGLSNLERILLSPNLDPKIVERIREEAAKVNPDAKIELFR